MEHYLKIWSAIDSIAERHGLSTSGLARRAGLDATTFNKSKRQSKDGKPRWPSTESIAKVLDATGLSLHDFMTGGTSDDAKPTAPSVRRIPMVMLPMRDSGMSASASRQSFCLPDFSDPKLYAVVVGGSMFEPILHEGDILIISPSANIRRGDPMLLKPHQGMVAASRLMRQTSSRLDVMMFGGATPILCSYAIDRIDWMHRIAWIRTGIG